MKLLDLTLPSPAENLALDEALLDSAEEGQMGEVLRFWESREMFVVVGYANKVISEVNVSSCEAQGVPILRRCSGGGTVVQGPGCLNYALVLKISEDGSLRNITSANRFIMERNRSALEEASHQPVEVQGHTDLAIGGRKFSGNSQRRRRNFLLFHGTFLLNFDLARVADLLAMPSKEPAYRNNRSHEDFLMNLSASSGLLKTALSKAWSAFDSAITSPARKVSELVETKYDRNEWNSRF